MIRVVQRAILVTEVDFAVIEGMRSIKRQRELFNAGASWRMDSRHITGHAIDLAAWVGTIRWDWPLYDKIAAAMFKAAYELEITIEWGGDWGKKDGPHFQLSRKEYL